MFCDTKEKISSIWSELCDISIKLEQANDLFILLTDGIFEHTADYYKDNPSATSEFWSRFDQYATLFSCADSLVFESIAILDLITGTTKSDSAQYVIKQSERIAKLAALHNSQNSSRV